jgi:hypothetical protein
MKPIQFKQVYKISGLIFLFILCSTAHSLAQGCVAARGNSICGLNINNNLGVNKGDFTLQTGLRYFKSFRHFRGEEEETNRIEEGTQVINHSYFLDLGLNYAITDRFFANALVPFVKHSRSSMYEHGGNPPNGLGERHETNSIGISDVRLSLGYWLFNPAKHAFNYSISAGVKLPTGKYDYTDTFYNQGENKDENIEAVVDQSIQPGDGGTGFTLGIQGFHPISDKFLLTTDMFYLFSPQENNGVLTRNGKSYFSIPDQFGARLGVYYTPMFHGLSFYFGGRLEGIPASDAIGSSAEYRRPGYIVSLEPGLNYSSGNFNISLNVPLAVYRNRIQSFQDKEATLETGVYKHGDAAFADYLLNFSCSYRIPGKHHSIMD